MDVRGDALSTGGLLRRYRLVAGLTQEELAERSGYSVHYVSKLERDERPVPHAALDRLAAALDLGDEERTALRAAADGGADVEPTAPLLAGRIHEVSEIRRHLAGIGPPVLLLSGEPGIGKTRLLAEAAARAAESGWRVIQGGCQRRAQDPYAPLTEALADTIDGLPPAQRAATLRDAGQLSLLLPELGGTGAIPSDHPTGEWTETVRRSDQDRRLLFASVGRFLRAAGGEQGTLLILDDLQWADSDAFDLLAAAVSGSDTPPVRLIAAYRDSETTSASPLSSFIADLARASLVRVLPLEPLSAAEAEELVAGLLPEGAASRQALLPAITRRAGGVPFFLVSYVEDLRAGGDVESDLDLPWSVSQVILQRVVALPDEAQELLRVAAIVGRAVPASLLSRVTGRSPEEVLEGLDVATSARLLHEEGEEGYHFTHDLIRETIEGQLSSSRRRLLHRRIGEALERDPRTPAESLAFHFDQSDDGERAIPHLKRAGDDALQRFAHTAAAHFYGRAVDRLERSDRPHEVAPIYEKLGIAHYQSGQYDEAVAALEHSLAGYRAADDAEGVDRVTGRLADAHFQRGTGHEALDQVTDLVERGSLEREGGGSPGAMALREGLVRLLYAEGSFKRMLTVGRSLRHMGRFTGNQRLQTMGMRVEGSALVFMGRLAEGAATIASTMPGDPMTDRGKRITEIGNVLGTAYFVMGAVNQTLAVSTGMLRVAESANDAVEIATHTLLIGAALHVEGEWEQAGEYLGHAQECFTRLGPSAHSVRMIPILADALMKEGRWEEARLQLDATLQMARSMRAHHPERTALTFLAQLDLLEGQPNSAIARLTPLVTEDLGWAHAVTLLFTLAEAWLEIGEVEHARPLAERAVSEARRMEAWLPGVEALRVLGMVHMKRRSDDMAERAFDEGLHRARAMPFPYAEARILHASGLLDRQRGDVPSSHAKFSEALAIVELLGATRQAAGFRKAAG